MKDLNNNTDYLIVQKINNRKYTNKIESPANIKEIQKLIECLVGNILVYLYTDNNSSKDLTEELGKLNEKIDYSKLYKIGRIKYTNIKAIENNSAIGEFYLTNLFVYTEEFIPKILTYRGVICKQRAFYNISRFEVITDNKQENQRKINAGADYEKFIAKKYTNSGYDIILNGIEKGKADEGIDIIAIKDGKTILVQCKNWKDTGYTEIYDKDIRAFFGDCFKYILDNSLLNRTVAMHYIIANEETMNQSAKIYLQKNTHIKYRCVAFEIED